jgi:hypothetical protein
VTGVGVVAGVGLVARVGFVAVTAMAGMGVLTAMTGMGVVPASAFNVVVIVLRSAAVARPGAAAVLGGSFSIVLGAHGAPSRL